MLKLILLTTDYYNMGTMNLQVYNFVFKHFILQNSIIVPNFLEKYDILH